MGNTYKKELKEMIIYVLQALQETITLLVISTTIVLLLNYLFIKDFRKLVNKIKRVISNPEQVNKITQIKNIIYNYFF